MFQYDSELADQYYLEHYADTNNTMYICTPYIPMIPDLQRKYVERHPNTYSMVLCDPYQLGYLKRLHQQKHLSYIVIYLVASAIIAITGLFGE